MPVLEIPALADALNLIGSGRLDLPLEPVDLECPPPFVRELVLMYLGALDHHQITFLGGGIIQTDFDV